jgi:hypothetical protein
VRRLLPWAFFAVAVLFAATALGDAATERAARALRKKAIEHDSLNVDYPAAIKKLQAAVAKCGAVKCGQKLRASLVRDLGAMQVLGGDVPAGQASFDRAALLDPTMLLDPAYANPTLQGMWSASVKKAVGGDTAPTSSGSGAAGGAGTQPTGDFVHAPLPEALVRTPLPVYVEYPGSEKLTRVALKYKGASASDWKALDMQKVGSGYGALIPCTDVGEGDMQYTLQGYAGDDVVATSGTRAKPYTVPVKAQIAGAPPSLPGQDPPKQCAETVAPVCPPDSPGCNAPKKDDAVAERAPTETPEANDKDAGEEEAFPRIWVGFDVGFDLFLMSAGTDVCQLNAAGTGPLSGRYYCVDPDSNVNVPGAVGTLNPPADPRSWNASIRHGVDDALAGGIAPGNLRLMLSFDYAVTQNVLVGLRAGYVLFTYPGGNPAAPASPSAPFAPLHFEARFTYLVGRNALTTPGVHPMFYVGAGVAEADAKLAVLTSLDKNACPNPGNPLCPASYNANNLPVGATQENAWLTAGPFFFKAGLGLRINLGKRFALSVGAGFLGAVGGTAGFLPGLEPEVGGQVGF